MVALTAGACRSDSNPESDLGGLLHSTVSDAAPIDVAAAADKLEELERAVAEPCSRACVALGAHRSTTTAKVEIKRGSTTVSTLTTETTLLYDGKGAFAVTAYNDKDYGRDAIFDGTTLYLRPRFGKYNKRAPEDAGEPSRLLDEILSTPLAYFELVAPGIAIRKSAETTVSKRAAVVVEVELASSPRPRPTEPLTQRKWRETAATKAVAGTIGLDKETGALLAMKLEAQVAFTRDGDNFVMSLSLEHAVTDVGTSATVEVPADADTVTAPRTLGELEERESLLKGIAAPARRGKTPDNPTGAARVRDATSP